MTRHTPVPTPQKICRATKHSATSNTVRRRNGKELKTFSLRVGIRPESGSRSTFAFPPSLRRHAASQRDLRSVLHMPLGAISSPQQRLHCV
ncbi:hypothetical protein NDU88_001181 [Pleurodeles waltl]|uniref:Uncharacterized protein n=1 Tax=Pleurodeles waltl TaxID=8319 RepID=A0AAV7SYS3_PLEWA|nr:hypothetical protein NDU88_001181 [Pleurodeles waltl]